MKTGNKIITGSVVVAGAALSFYYLVRKAKAKKGWYRIDLVKGVNYVSLPVIPPNTDPIAIFGPEAVYRHNNETCGAEIATTVKCMEGYLVYTSIAKRVWLTGTACVVTLENLIAALKTGWNLVGPGNSVLDFAGTNYYPMEWIRDETEEGGGHFGFITILEPLTGYWILKCDFGYTYPGDTIEAGDEITFVGDIGCEDEDAGIYTFNWDFGDGITATGTTVTHTYAAQGAYTVKLTLISVADDAVYAECSKDLAVGVCPIPACAFAIT